MDSRTEKAISITHEFLQSGVILPFSTEVGPKLLAISSGPVDEIDVDKFVELIELDPGLTTNVLQLANSVYFSGLKKIVSLRRAVIQIGLEEAVNFINLVFFRKSMPEFPEIANYFSDKDFWGHSWACAIACKYMGHPTVGSSISVGELYIAGLLHGVGKLVLALQHPDEFLQSLENSVDYSISLLESQIDIFGTTDVDIACELLRVWQMPENICLAIKHFHRPDEAQRSTREFAGLLQLSYFIANTSGIGNVRDEFNYDVNDTWIARASGLPLSNEEIRNDFVQAVYILLEKKQGAIESIGLEEKPDAPMEEGERNKNRPDKTDVKRNWWSRIFLWLKAQFR